MDGKVIGLIIAAVIVLVVIVLAYVGIYNGLIAGQQNVNEKWAQVETQYQRRVDLIPNVVNTVKGSSNFEQTTLMKIVELRSQWGVASTQQEKLSTANQIESELSRLLVVFENYPDIKSTEAYQDLITQLEGTENRVAFARGEYNIAVKQFNISIQSIPGVWFAPTMGLTAKSFFESKSGAENPVDVNFQ